MKRSSSLTLAVCMLVVKTINHAALAHAEQATNQPVRALNSFGTPESSVLSPADTVGYDILNEPHSCGSGEGNSAAAIDFPTGGNTLTLPSTETSLNIRVYYCEAATKADIDSLEVVLLSPQGNQSTVISFPATPAGYYQDHYQWVYVPFNPAQMDMGYNKIFLRTRLGSSITTVDYRFVNRTAPMSTPLPTTTATLPTPSPTPVPTAVPTATPTPIPTAIPTATPLPTSTPVPTPTPIPTATPVPTATPTPTPLPTIPPPDPTPTPPPSGSYGNSVILNYGSGNSF